MKQILYQVDAFSKELFKGNPAAVCILESWPDDHLMQLIASENNLSETAFVVPAGEQFKIRWFTPVTEVDLCGHATLASAHVIFEHLQHDAPEVEFESRFSGTLKVARNEEGYTMDFPADKIEHAEVPALMTKALRSNPLKAFRGRTDYMLIYAREEEILEISPDFGQLSALGSRGVIVTAMGHEADFVSRFFAPGAGINEDPVTGSAHTTLTPYWSGVLGKQKLNARQVSARSGDLVYELKGDRVLITGHAVTYLVGEITLTEDGALGIIS